MGASWLLLDYDVVNFRHHVNLDPGDVRLHIVVEPVLEVIPALPYLGYVKLAVSHEGHVGDEPRRGQKGGASVALTPCRTNPSSCLKQTTSPIPTCSLLFGFVVHVLRRAPYSHAPPRAPDLWRSPVAP